MKIEDSIVPIKIADFVSYIAKRKRMAVTDAMCYLYNSEMANNLYDENAKWWYLDNETLYGYMEQMRRDENGGLSARELQFIVFCVENYARQKHLSSLEVFALFRRSGMYRFLTDNYDVLHTQGDAYILDEITKYLKKRRLA